MITSSGFLFSRGQGIQQRAVQGRVLLIFCLGAQEGWDRLYLFTASSRHQYVLTHEDNEQLALMWMLAEGDMGLNTVLTEAGVVGTAEETIEGALDKGNAAVWSILAGLSQLTGENAFTLPKQNRKLLNAPKRDGDSIESWANDYDVARSMNFKASLEEPESVPVDDEQG